MKAIFFIAAFISIAMVCPLTYAHQPLNIEIRYDAQRKIMFATVDHHVRDVREHYIEKVCIGLNGKAVKEIPYRGQTTNRMQKVKHYMRDTIESGDIIFVEAYCNVSGKLKKEIRIQ
ncbi:MAG: hypothetical protein KKH94_08360 [Candidatus Omnitrophica bacterium]|nr:hypothetical protein [Candidatus Omnitrophota bacterium]